MADDWFDWTPQERYDRQMESSELLMPWSIFHEAAENVLGRPVSPIELAMLKGQCRDT